MVSERFPAHSGRLVIGVLVMIFGILLTLDNLELIHNETLDWFWPCALIALSLTQFLSAKAALHRAWSGSLCVIGAVWLVMLVMIPGLDIDLGDLWPLVIILVGVALLIGATPKWRQLGSEESDGGSVNTFAVLSGQKRVVRDAAFRSGNVGAFMGGSVLDLRQAALAPGGAVVDVAVMMGGVEIWVPESWMVSSEVLPIMGGFEDRTRSPAFDTGDRLTVRGVVMMGAVEMKNGPSKQEEEDEDE